MQTQDDTKQTSVLSQHETLLENLEDIAKKLKSEFNGKQLRVRRYVPSYDHPRHNPGSFFKHHEPFYTIEKRNHGLFNILFDPIAYVSDCTEARFEPIIETGYNLGGNPYYYTAGYKQVETPSDKRLGVAIPNKVPSSVKEIILSGLSDYVAKTGHKLIRRPI